MAKSLLNSSFLSWGVINSSFGKSFIQCIWDNEDKQFVTQKRNENYETSSLHKNHKVFKRSTTCSYHKPTLNTSWIHNFNRNAAAGRANYSLIRPQSFNFLMQVGRFLFMNHSGFSAKPGWMNSLSDVTTDVLLKSASQSSI